MSVGNWFILIPLCTREVRVFLVSRTRKSPCAFPARDHDGPTETLQESPQRRGAVARRRHPTVRPTASNDDDVHQHGLPDHSTGKEFSFVDSSELLLRKTRRFGHVFEIVLQAQLTLLRVHTGTASANTSARNFTEISRGVSRSTRTPSSSCNSY